VSGEAVGTSGRTPLYYNAHFTEWWLAAGAAEGTPSPWGPQRSSLAGQL